MNRFLEISQTMSFNPSVLLQDELTVPSDTAVIYILSAAENRHALWQNTEKSHRPINSEPLGLFSCFQCQTHRMMILGNITVRGMDGMEMPVTYFSYPRQGLLPAKLQLSPAPATA